jgi:hypothetical protein
MVHAHHGHVARWRGSARKTGSLLLANVLRVAAGTCSLLFLPRSTRFSLVPPAPVGAQRGKVVIASQFCPPALS